MTEFVKRELTIRRSDPHDAAAIRDLLRRSFGGDGEAQLVGALELDGDLSLSLVAETDGGIVGYIAYSPLELEGNEARGHALAPLAVLPEYQRNGIGKTLVAEAHDILKRMGQDFMLVLGDPAYYGHFGFSAETAKPFSTPYDGPYMQVLILSESGQRASGRVTYAHAFSGMEGEH